MKQDEPRKIEERIPCNWCEETGNANWQHPHRPHKVCNHCSGLGWTVKKPEHLRRHRKAKK